VQFLADDRVPYYDGTFSTKRAAHKSIIRHTYLVTGLSKEMPHTHVRLWAKINVSWAAMEKSLMAKCLNLSYKLYYPKGRSAGRREERHVTI
jgi:hypothetical protein